MSEDLASRFPYGSTGIPYNDQGYTNPSRYHLGQIDGHSENLHTPRKYGIEGYKGGP